MDFFPPASTSELTSDELILRINSLAYNFNFMGSIRSINRCYIDGKIHSSSELFEETIYGCMARIPYNTIPVSKVNQWAMKAIRLLFCKMNNIIPHTLHNLPSVFKIRRSNGKLHDVVAVDPIYCIRIKKTPSPSGKTNDIILYVRVHFIESEPILSDDMRNQLQLVTHCGSFKDVPLHDIYKENPTLPEFEIEFNRMKKTADMPEIADAVIENINNDFDSWCKSDLQNSLNNYSNKYQVKCSYKFI
jgi:hypothetical protein